VWCLALLRQTWSIRAGAVHFTVAAPRESFPPFPLRAPGARFHPPGAARRPPFVPLAPLAPRPSSGSHSGPMLALARKYRPKNFAQVAVQTHVSNTLKGAIARGRVAHGYLLCGPRGTGKTTLARVLAMALNCENRGADGTADAGEPCGSCVSCTRIWSGAASLDVVEIDAASNRGVDDARELRERAMYAPSGEDRYKVYIVDEAHMLTRDAWNALLKILEEPPPRVVFVFATTEPQKIAQAAAPVMSRLQRFDLKRIGPVEIRERLAAVLDAEGVAYEPDALAMIARSADGGLRDALSLTDQVLSLGAEAHVTADRVSEALGLVPEDEFIAVLDVIAERRAGDVFAVVARLAEQGIDFGSFVTGLADMLRAQLAIALGGAAPDLSERARVALEERRGRLGPADILRMLNTLMEVEPRFRRSGQQQLLLETLLVRFALLDRTVALEDVLRGLAGGATGGGGGGQGGAPRADTSAPRGAASMAGDRGAASAAPPRAAPAPYAAPPRSAPVPEAPTSAAPGASGGGWSASSGPGATATLAPPVPLAAPAAVPTAAPTSAPTVAPAPPSAPAPARAGGVPDVNTMVERWDAVVAHARAAGRMIVATALQTALPVGVTAAGAVTVQLEESNDTFTQALEAARDDVLAAVRTLFPGATRVVLLQPEGSGAPVAPQRLTAESVKEERVATLRKRDGLLDAAIDALDLDLVE
jgi:DNA polymerase-3 subunit gamma/tau